MGALVFWLGVGLLLALVLLAARAIDRRDRVEGTTSGPAGRWLATPGSTGVTPWPATASAT
jgi:hypothetical protein